ncbi:MAG: DUF2273 domain-containing protein [bacterium]
MDSKFFQYFYEIFNYNKGKIIGAIFGFIFGLLLLFIGFWRTILVFTCTTIGYYISSRWDVEGDFKKLLDRILPPQMKQ